jgi:osmoprotectant transport system substrate-binding protein
MVPSRVIRFPKEERMKVRIWAVCILALSVILSACDTGTASNPTATPAPAATSGSTSAGGKVVVSSKNFTEEVILGEMYAQVLENAGVPVDRKLNLGTTAIAQEALVKGGANGGIDLYPEYTSTGLIAVLKQAAINDPEAAYQAVKKGYETQFKLTWLDKTPMNDTQAMVTTKDMSDQKGIKSLQDLCDKASDLTIAARSEFQTREDALPALQKIYGGCKFKEIKVVESALLYKALTDKQVDAAQADGTAGEIAGYSLVLLADPKHYGPPDNVAPVVRDDVLAKYPQISDLLNGLSAKITDSEISALNWDVAGNKKEPADVAKAWLVKQGLLK